MTQFIYWLLMPGFFKLTELMHNGNKQKVINVTHSIIKVTHSILNYDRFLLDFINMGNC